MLGITIAFAIGFATFVVLMVVLAVFVLRFAIREGRRRPPAERAGAGPDFGPDPHSPPGPS